MAKVFKFKDRELVIGNKTYIMGILNATPDSFSDGGRFQSLDAALSHAKQMIDDGADILDVGGESTRPGYQRVDANEEIDRVCRLIERIRQNFDIPISVDTQKAVVAREALGCGADIINDIWGLQGDADMVKAAKESNSGIIAMHNSDSTEYGDYIGDICSFFEKTLLIADANGIDRQRICLDPGIGFGKTFEQNIEAMRSLDKLKVHDCPMLLGASRKSFIGKITGLEVDERLEGSLASVAIGIQKGMDFVRVHDVKQTKRFVTVYDYIVRG